MKAQCARNGHAVVVPTHPTLTRASAGQPTTDSAEASGRVSTGFEPMPQRPGRPTRTDNRVPAGQEAIDSADDEALVSLGRRIALLRHDDGLVGVDDDGRRAEVAAADPALQAAPSQSPGPS